MFPDRANREDGPRQAGRPDASVSRVVAGIMSGTSLDGIDIAIVEVVGTGAQVRVRSKAFSSVPYSSALREAILRNCEPSTSSVSELSRINAEIALEYAAAVRATCESSGIALSDIDLVGSHGQTVYHDPSPQQGPASTLQIGDPSMLAHHLGLPVVGDFRVGDVALGGQGAPLVPYFDWALFSSSEENRVLLNLGGIANITVLPVGCGPDQVIAFDTGPANVLIDSVMMALTGRHVDEGGQLALEGKANTPLLQEMLSDPYFTKAPPKSTGREWFNAAYVDQLLRASHEVGLSVPDIVATATAFTVNSILIGIAGFVPFPLDRLIVSGGGVHNQAIMTGLSDALPSCHVDSIAQHGIDPDAKEAICFAVLAHEAFNRVAAGMPSVTGASGRAFLGKICFPGN